MPAKRRLTMRQLRQMLRLAGSGTTEEFALDDSCVGLTPARLRQWWHLLHETKFFGTASMRANLAAQPEFTSRNLGMRLDLEVEPQRFRHLCRRAPPVELVKGAASCGCVQDRVADTACCKLCFGCVHEFARNAATTKWRFDENIEHIPPSRLGGVSRVGWPVEFHHADAADRAPIMLHRETEVRTVVQMHGKPALEWFCHCPDVAIISPGFAKHSFPMLTDQSQVRRIDCPYDHVVWINFLKLFRPVHFCAHD